MVEKASYSYEQSVNDVEAFQVGFQNDKYGGEWSYKAKGAITGIIMIRYLNYDWIGTLIFQSVNEKGMTEYSTSFGSGTNSNATVYKVILDGPDEYFTSLSGTTLYEATSSSYRISSLSFETNKRKLGPFGPKVTTNTFEFPLKGRIIVGFYGGAYPHAHLSRGLGVYVKHSREFFAPLTPKIQFGGPYKEEECIKIQPWGWSRSMEDQPWSYMLKSNLTYIKIGFTDAGIQSISFKSSNDNIEFNYSQKLPDKATKYETFPINSPQEFFISIDGTTNSSNEVIQSICFYTNKNIWGPYGYRANNRFRLGVEGGVITGFHGSVGNFFQTFGVYIKQLSELGKEKPNKTKEEEAPKVRPSDGQGSSPKVKPSGDSDNNNGSTKIPPHGGQGGKEWDYKPNGAIVEIIISHGWVIDSLCFQSVDKNDDSEYSDKYGGDGGKEVVVTIEWPREYLTSISGTHIVYKKQHVIESLCFHTNERTIGPFGGKRGTPFDMGLKDGTIVGFHGRYDDYIDAIGVYHKSSTV